MSLPPGTELNDDVLTEILLRLPTKSVLCCRAVCKQWRLVATCVSFVAAYSRRRPLDLLLYRNRYGKNHKYAIDTVPLDGRDGCRRLLDHGYNLKYFGSCDGLLLFLLHGDGFVICNPATRQCARFPRLVPTPCSRVKASGFYLHRPSGEHRVLCIANDVLPSKYYDWTDGSYYNNSDEDGGRWATRDAAVEEPSHQDKEDEGAFLWRSVHYVFSTGAAQHRRLGPFPESRKSSPFPSPGVDVGGTLHWARHPANDRDSFTMLTFDTVSETFRQMRLPPADTNDNNINLFDMRGTLAASAMSEWPYMDVWALDDYAGERWSRRFRVELPAAATVPSSGVKYGEAVAALEGDVLVLFTVGGWVTLYDVKEKRTVRVVRRGDNLETGCRRDNLAKTSWCVYRESLVPAVIDGMPCSSGVVPFDDELEAESVAINYSLDDTA